MYALSTTISYQDDLDDLLNQHSEILADKFVLLIDINLKIDLIID